MSATIDLVGPSTDPDAPQIDPEEVNAQVNAALAANAATAAVAAQAAAALAASALPLIGGKVTGTVHFNDAPAPLTTGGAIQSLRNITLVQPSTNTANKPFFLQNTFTGVNLDPPPGGNGPLYASSITNIFNNYNTGQLGARGFGVLTEVGPLSIGATFSAVTSSVLQIAPHPPTTVLWAPNTVFATNTGVTNPNNLLTYYAVVGGTSAASGTGPSGQGQAIPDGTNGLVWAYQGPGIPAYWAPTTPYLTQGILVTNPNNGGLFRVETPGTSGNAPGPVRPRTVLTPARLASTANLTLSGTPIIDSVQSAIGDRVLAKNQTAPADNGVYIVASGAWPRSIDADAWSELVSRFISVTAGTVNAGAGFLCNIVNGGTIGTTPITWVASAAPNINAITDGSVVWSLRSIGNAASSFIGLIGNATTSFNMGGQSFNESVGTQWGALIGSHVIFNAKFVSASVGVEIDDRMEGSSRNIVGLKLVRLGKQAQFGDLGILISASIGSITPDGTPVRGYKNSFVLNGCADKDNGYGISFESVGQFRFQHMAGAIDARMVVPDGTQGLFGGGFIFRWVNGLLDQFGAQQMRFGSIVPTASGLTIDVTNQELQGVVIVSPGSNWSVADGWKGSDGSAGFVTAVDGSGGIATISIPVPGQVPSSAVPTTITLSPFNPEAPFAANGDDPVPGTVGPTGDVIWPTPATGTPTYAAPATPTLNFGTGLAAVINLGRTGQKIGFNGATAVIKPTVTGSKAANAALASLLTALASYGLVLDSST